MNIYLKIALFTILGAALGYAYYYFYGCTNGCAITSNSYITTAYGAFTGLIIGLPMGKRTKDENKAK